MVKQVAVGLNSRSEANPFDENGFLPLITAPMYSVVNENNYQIFLDNKIQVCFPRNTIVPIDTSKNNNLDIIFKNTWRSLSLNEFIEFYVENSVGNLSIQVQVCIDTANGNIPALHDSICKAKELHGNNLIIMAGNVSSVEAFLELAKTGVDYIRVGIGGGGGCNTTSNTGVGQNDLERLIRLIKILQKDVINGNPFDPTSLSYSHIWDVDFKELMFTLTEKEKQNIINTKVVADGISSYITQCQTKYGFNDNGYAAINKLLFAGADLVMVGKLFAQCLESAGEKLWTEYRKVSSGLKLTDSLNYIDIPFTQQGQPKIMHLNMKVKYSGMSTQEEQQKYKKGVFWDAQNNMEEVDKDYKPVIKPSEGSVNWIPVRWTLNDWLYGSNEQDRAPYLMGWINSIKSAMSYTGKTTL
jgi:hypothetical protein